jgi:hypothetical protein
LHALLHVLSFFFFFRGGRHVSQNSGGGLHDPLGAWNELESILGGTRRGRQRKGDEGRGSERK